MAVKVGDFNPNSNSRIIEIRREIVEIANSVGIQVPKSAQRNIVKLTDFFNQFNNADLKRKKNKVKKKGGGGGAIDELTSGIMDISKKLEEAGAIMSDPKLKFMHGETLGVRGKSYINLGQDTQEQVDAYHELVSEIRSYAKNTGVELGDEVSGHIDLTKLPMKKARAFRERWDELIGLSDVLINQGRGRDVVSPHAASLDQKLSPWSVYSVDPTEEAGFRTVAYIRGSLQFRPEMVGLPGTQTTDAYTLGYRIPTPEFAAREAERLNSGGLIPEGRKAIIDIETAGLRTEHGMWQLSVRYSDDLDTAHTLFFDAPKLKYGTMWDDATSSSVPLSHLQLDGKEMATIDDLKAVLRGVVGSDYISGHNISAFDIPYLIEDIPRIGANLSPDGVPDDELLGLVDELKAKSTRGEVVDTMSTMSSRLSELGVTIAPEMSDVSKYNVRSVENILLQTNMLDLMARSDKYRDGLGMLEMLEEGLHDSGIDTYFESAFIDQDILDQLEAVGGPDEFSIYNLSKARTSRVRELISQAQAVSPWITMDAKGISPQVQALMDAAGTENITWYEHSILEQRAAGQSLVASSDLANTLDLHLNAGIMDNFRADFGGGAALVDDFLSTQQKLADLGMPFHFLSKEEREIGGFMANASYVDAVDFGAREHLDQLMPSGTFYSDGKIRTVGGEVAENMRIVIPDNVLEHLEARGAFTHGGIQRTSIASGEELYSLSPFKQGGSQSKNVAMTFHLSKDEGTAIKEAENIYRILKEEAGDFGISESELANLQKALVGDGGGRGAMRYGIQVALAKPISDTGPHGQSNVDNLYDSLVRAAGGSPEGVAPRDLSAPTFVVGRSGTAAEVGSKRMVPVGPAVLDAGIDDNFRKEYAAASRASQEVIGKVSDDLGSGNLGGLLANYMKKHGKEPMGGSAIKFISKSIRSNSSSFFAGAAALAGGIGYYAHEKRENRNAYFSDALAPMPTESGDWYGDYRSEMGLQGGGGTMSYARPFNTMNVVGDLDRGKIGHTNMGADKNSHLFAGVM